MKFILSANRCFSGILAMLPALSVAAEQGYPPPPGAYRVEPPYLTASQPETEATAEPDSIAAEGSVPTNAEPANETKADPSYNASVLFGTPAAEAPPPADWHPPPPAYMPPQSDFSMEFSRRNAPAAAPYPGPPQQGAPYFEPMPPDSLGYYGPGNAPGGYGAAPYVPGYQEAPWPDSMQPQYYPPAEIAPQSYPPDGDYFPGYVDEHYPAMPQSAAGTPGLSYGAPEDISPGGGSDAVGSAYSGPTFRPADSAPPD